jgi:hypothetical protein
MRPLKITLKLKLSKDDKVFETGLVQAVNSLVFKITHYQN